MNPIKERLHQFIEHKGIAPANFERIAHLSNGVVTKTDVGLSKKSITLICEAFPELNRSWLEIGEGEMLKRPSVPEKLDTDVQENNEGLHMIPFYDAETTGGFNGLVSSSNTEVSLSGYINAGDWFGGYETAAIRHVGDSMTEYPDGCILVVKEVRQWRLLVPGRNYVIETDEYRVTKRIQNGHSKNLIALYSSNQERYADGRLIYEPFEVDLDDIRRIFSVLGYIVNQSGRPTLIQP